ncbi:MAG: hypothetical protein H7293_00595 [Candidatus Saccharibacteria bacterium]|nr:hypothetical protein [Rhodoferax sp.]
MSTTAWAPNGDNSNAVAVIFEPQNLVLYGTGILTTPVLLCASLAAGVVLALIFAMMFAPQACSCAWVVRLTLALAADRWSLM